MLAKGRIPPPPVIMPQYIFEKNGPAAFHVADGKNVDLNWIYREVIG